MDLITDGISLIDNWVWGQGRSGRPLRHLDKISNRFDIPLKQDVKLIWYWVDVSRFVAVDGVGWWKNSKRNQVNILLIRWYFKGVVSTFWWCENGLVWRETWASPLLDWCTNSTRGIRRLFYWLYATLKGSFLLSDDAIMAGLMVIICVHLNDWC